ncbi:NADH dehydrogenase [ubiquinone] 1 beta subcomplex subunit 4-like [Strongylocentrotus purpuratus]|uniref:NADH dehydrogenase [ubiquinone] 1 beta subcomplex subunit 4 n=1 Tax=Strongylocentrotus purpuratus TaxID=7668 RepID=A0A7M7PI20_STRPU|nr:NADH dehydrogenase [ubiquinone] 1 beta subcomplex subunit 4-like [Strongylocentrotus purpuratus]
MAPSTEWGVPAAEKQAELQRSQIRSKIRNDYQRKINNPRHTGSLIDPAYFRWNYARHNSYAYFKATKLTSITGAIMGIAIPAGLIYFFYRHRKYTQEMYDSGQWAKPRNLVNG